MKKLSIFKHTHLSSEHDENSIPRSSTAEFRRTTPRTGQKAKRIEQLQGEILLEADKTSIPSNCSISFLFLSFSSFFQTVHRLWTPKEPSRLGGNKAGRKRAQSNENAENWSSAKGGKRERKLVQKVDIKMLKTTSHKYFSLASNIAQSHAAATWKISLLAGLDFFIVEWLYFKDSYKCFIFILLDDPWSEWNIFVYNYIKF